MRIFGRILLSSVMVFSTVAVQAKAPAKHARQKRKMASTDRPPQFVLLAFDGSKDNNFWEESFDYAKSTPTHDVAGNPSTAKFTYFVNPTYYTGYAYRSAYTTPRLGKPVSCIGWASDDQTTKSIPLRVANTNKAFLAGHEIGSHANAHCDQSGQDSDNPMYKKPWGEADWDSEFDQFNKLLFQTFTINKDLKKPTEYLPTGLAFTKDNIKGFRAPLLAYTSGLWPSLKKHGFTYDTSREAPPNYWPERQDWGGWNIPLARIKIAGSSKTVIGMDYNWLCFQSACETKPGLTDADRTRLQKQVTDSYMYYFKKNYFGNRAPVQLGHHFSQWNKGIYWNTMKDVMKNVCNRPEVRCVTFSEYVKWLNGLDENTYKDYHDGKFEHLKDDGTIRDIATPVVVDVQLLQKPEGFEAIVPESDKARLNVTGWKPTVMVNFQDQQKTVITRDELVQAQGTDSTFTVRAALIAPNGLEMNWQTYRINHFGTENETIVGPLEDRALQGETSEAHEYHEKENE